MTIWLDIAVLLAVGAGLFFALRAMRRRRACASGCDGCPLADGCAKKEEKKN